MKMKMLKLVKSAKNEHALASSEETDLGERLQHLTAANKLLDQLKGSVIAAIKSA